MFAISGPCEHLAELTILLERTVEMMVTRIDNLMLLQELKDLTKVSKKQARTLTFKVSAKKDLLA